MSRRYTVTQDRPAQRLPAPPSRVASAAKLPDAGVIETGDLWRILRARRWTLLVVALVIALAGSGYALFARSLYTATAQILIDPRDRQVVDRSLTSDAAPQDGGVTQVESQARLVESDAVLLRAMTALDLQNDPDFGPQSGLFARLRGGVLNDAASVSAETLRNLRRRLAVRRGDKALVIDVLVTAHRAENAARIASAIADAYVADVSATRERAARAASAALASRLDALHDRMLQAETALEAYKASAGFVGSNGLPVIDAQLAAANTDLSSAKARADAAAARLEQVRAMQSLGLLATSASDAASPVLSQLRTTVATQADALARLRVVYGPRHPTVLAAAAQLANAQAQVRVEVDRAARVAQADTERAQAEIESAQARLTQLEAQSAAANKRSVRLRELQREADTDRSVYQSFLTRSSELAAQAGVDVANLRIISQSLPPRLPSWPPRALIVAASILAGLALGTAWVLLREYMKPTVLSQAELRRRVGAQLVGKVSAQTLSRVEPAAAHMVDLRDVATGATLLRLLRRQSRPALSGRARCIGLISLQQQRNERGRLTTLMAGMAARQGLRVVVIGTEAVGSAPTGTAALPHGLTRAGEGGPAATAGAPGQVTRFAAGGDDALCTPAAAEELLAALGAQFDMVIVDLDDLVGSPQAASLAAASNDLVVVAREGRTDQDAIKQLAELADAVGRPVSAAVLVDGTGRL